MWRVGRHVVARLGGMGAQSRALRPHVDGGGVDLLLKKRDDDERLLLEGGEEERVKLLWVIEVLVSAEELHSRLRPKEALSHQLVVLGDAGDNVALVAGSSEALAEVAAQRRVLVKVDVEDARD